MATSDALPFATTIHVPERNVTLDPVELLIRNGVREVPSKFLRPKCERPCLGSVTTRKRIPCIDLGGVEGGEREREQVMREIGYACEEWGFFEVINHGVSEKLMEDMMRVAKEFFSLSMDVKASYAGGPGFLMQGYGSKYVLQETAIRDWRDYLYLHLLPLSCRQYEYWPTEIAHFRETVEEYSSEVQKLAQKLLAVFSHNLGVPAVTLEKALVQPQQKMLINYYPPCPEPHLTAGFHNHSDIGAVTVVLQEEDVVGLHVRKDGDWIPVQPRHGAFVVNVADQVEILSNGRYKSVEHRVVTNSDKSRISIPIFFDAAPEAKIAPLEELLNQDHPQRYKQIKFNDHEVTFYTYGPNGKKLIQSYITST